MEALTIIKQDHIDMVLLDVFMPIMDGIDLLKVLKQDETLKHIPVAILTTDDTKKAEALSLGACEVLIKPIKEDQLKTLLAANL